MILKSDLPAVRAHVELAFRRSLDEVVGEAKDHAPVSVSRGLKLNAGDAQGQLRASISAQGPTRYAGGWRARVGSPVRYAMMREFGGTIRPVRRKLLSWINPITGRRVFAKVVHQRPGGPRQGHKPWLRPAGDKWPQFFEDHLKALG